MKRKTYRLALFCAVVMLFLFAGCSVFAMESGVKPEFTGNKAYYNETDADSVTVTVNFSIDGVPIYAQNTVMADLQITVPYFDLAEYGLSELYRYPTKENTEYMEDSEVIKRPTVLHLFLYILERYAQGLPADQCGKGLLDQGKRGLAITNMFGVTAGQSEEMFSCGKIPTSCYIQSFWGHDLNFMYYVNAQYPLMYPGWGATADYILLQDGDTVDVGFFSDWDFYHTGAFVTLPQNVYTVEVGEISEITPNFTPTIDMDEDEVYQYGGKGFSCYIDQQGSYEKISTYEAGRVLIGPLTETGTYMMYLLEESAGTGNAGFTPANARLVVTESYTVQNLEKQINEIGTVEYTKECRKKLEAARAAYNALNDVQKSMVSKESVKKLEQAEAEYAAFKAAEDAELAAKAEEEAKNKAAADQVTELIGKIGKVDSSEASKVKIEAARTAYDALTDDQKLYISAETLRTLTIAETVYSTVVNDEQQAAQKVEALIGAIGTVVYTPECETAIQTARAAYDALEEHVRSLISEENVQLLIQAESTYKELKEKAELQAGTVTKLEQTKATQKSVTISWKEDQAATAGYRLYVRGGRYKKYTKVKDVAAGVTAYTITKAGGKRLQAGTQYEIKIIALKKSGKKLIELGNQKLKTTTVTAAPKITSAKRSKNKKSITLHWEKISGVSGYEIQMSTKAKSGFKKITTAKAKAVSYTKSGLKKTKTYYFRMRTYKTVKGSRFYSSWSKIVTVKK